MVVGRHCRYVDYLNLIAFTFGLIQHAIYDLPPPQHRVLAPFQGKDTFTDNLRAMVLKNSTEDQSKAAEFPLKLREVKSTGYEDDLFKYVEKQGEYITQLEKETKYYRDELGGLL